MVDYLKKRAEEHTKKKPSKAEIIVPYILLGLSMTGLLVVIILVVLQFFGVYLLS